VGKRLTLIGKGSYSDACGRTPTEWDFIQSLSYREQLAEEDAAFVKLVYTSRLNKVGESKPITLPLTNAYARLASARQCTGNKSE